MLEWYLWPLRLADFSACHTRDPGFFSIPQNTALDTISRLVFIRATTSDWLVLLVWLRVKAVFLYNPLLLLGELANSNMISTSLFLKAGLSFFFFYSRMLHAGDPARCQRTKPCVLCFILRGLQYSAFVLICFVSLCSAFCLLVLRFAFSFVFHFALLFFLFGFVLFCFAFLFYIVFPFLCFFVCFFMLFCFVFV